MYTLLVALLIIIALVLMAAILLQSGKGGGLAASFGGASSAANAFIGGRQAETILTKITWWGGGLFLGIAFVLQLMSTHASAPQSLLDKAMTNPPAKTQQQGAPPATNLPLQPAPSGQQNQPPTPKK